MTSAAAPRAPRSPLVAPGQVQHHAADMALTVAADVTLEQAQARLAEAGQWLALDGPGDRPLGWLMQHDSTGPLRLGYGGWRDVMTGVQFTDGQGSLVTVGGVTVKNVAGYDLVKFSVGSHGCFGAPVTMTLRTYRRPEAALAMGLEARLEMVRLLLESDAPPHWMLWTPEGLRAGWLGSSREMQVLAPVLEQAWDADLATRSLEDDEAERRRLLGQGPELVRISIAPSELAEVLAELPVGPFAADPAFGTVWMRVPERFSDVLEVVRRRGGHALWAGRDGVRVYGVGQDAQAVLERLKRRLDPDRKLPGLPFTV